MNLYSVHTTERDRKSGYIYPALPDTLVVADTISHAVSEVKRLFPSREIVEIERKYANVVIAAENYDD